MEDKNEDELDRLAREEIVKEARRGAERAKDMGAYGWVKPSGATTNKKFLGNVLVSTLRSYNRKKKLTHDHDHRDSRQWKWRTGDGHRKHYYEKRGPKLVNDGFFHYNDPKKYSDKAENADDSSQRKKGKNEKYSFEDFKEKESQDKNENEEKHVEKSGEDKHQEKKDQKKKKVKEKKKSAEKNNNKEEQTNSEVINLNQEETGSEYKEVNCGDELLAESIYYDDTIKVYRKRKNCSQVEEDSLIAGVKCYKAQGKDENPEEIILDFVGDYLIDKRQKKKSKHKEKKSHKSKHKHKKHKHKTKKSKEKNGS